MTLLHRFHWEAWSGRIENAHPHLVGKVKNAKNPRSSSQYGHPAAAIPLAIVGRGRRRRL
eukprot:5956713-Prymnesium_polylepis.1